MALRFPPSPATRRRMRGNNLHAPLNEVDYRLVSVFSPGTTQNSPHYENSVYVGFFPCREAARSCRSVGRKKNNKKKGTYGF